MGAARERKWRLGGWLPPEESFGSAMGWESRSLLLGGKGGGVASFIRHPFLRLRAGQALENPTEIAVAAPPRPDPTKTP